MMLPVLIALLFGGGIVAWFSERLGPEAPRWVATATLLLATLLVAGLYRGGGPFDLLSADAEPVWIADYVQPWMPRFGITFYLAVDGLSLLLIGLTMLLGFMAISSAGTEISERRGLFFFNLLSCMAGIVGVFLAVDLFLFFFFWELMIIPMFFLISIWGYDNPAPAALKFFIFTQVSSLLMLLAIVVLALANQHETGELTFNYFALQDVRLDPGLSYYLMLGFVVAFIVKLPTLPFHSWLPDTYSRSPTAVTLILAGAMSKTGAYGLLRFTFSLFPDAAAQFTPVAMGLGAVTVLYGASLAYVQSYLKRLVAYTSVSHMGFILLGVFSWNYFALQGAVVTMLAHGVSVAALFMIAGFLRQRLGTGELKNMGGFWSSLPRLSAFTLFFAMASLGLPGLGNFIGEFLVLLGAFDVSAFWTAVAALGFILGPVYALLIVQKVCDGPPLTEEPPLIDFSHRELAALGLLALTTLWLGLYPRTVLNVSAPSLKPLALNTVEMER